jgi:RNA-directed DNA polymerase
MSSEAQDGGEKFRAEWNAGIGGVKNTPKSESLPYPTFQKFDSGKANWGDIIWGPIKRRVFNIQRRIHKATVDGRYKQARNLMKLLNRSTCAIVLGVRMVTQDNSGRKTPGVDGETALSPAKRVRLVERLLDLALKGWDDYKAKPLKRRLIPKPNGKKRPLGIPTIEDRAVQATIKLALEPFYEAKFESNSFRGKSFCYRKNFCLERIQARHECP